VIVGRAIDTTEPSITNMKMPRNMMKDRIFLSFLFLAKDALSVARVSKFMVGPSFMTPLQLHAGA
jgi:hypothetical protein